MYTLLIADDETDERTLIRFLLKDFEYTFHILEAPNGRDALELLTSNHVDVLLSDIQMPFINGIDLVSTVKEKNPDIEFYLFTKKASHRHTDIKYGENPFFFFGRESCGLPEEFLERYKERCVRIPMKEGLRSLNQSNSAAIAAYEYLRQKDFSGLSDIGGRF